MKKRKNKILLLLVLLLAITIGFAALATTLKINGTANIGKSSWNIYWDNVANQKGVTPDDDPEITADENNVPKSLLTWEVDLNTPGDYYEFEVDAVNAGSLDAEIIGITSKYDNTPVISTENGVIVEDNSVIPSYIKYSIKYKDDGEKPDLGDSLPKAPNPTATPPVYTRKTYVIHVEYDKDAVTPAIVNNMNENGENHTFTFEVTYGQATTPAAEDFATDSWKTIAAEGNEVAKQTSTDGSCGAYNLGDTKSVDMGTLGTHTVRIINCSTPAICSTEGFSQTACGFVIEFYDTIGEKKMNYNGSSNAGGWNASEIRAYLNGGTTGTSDYSEDNVLSKLPSALQAVIDDQTYIVSSHGSTDSNNFTLRDSLFIASAGEIWENVGTNWDSIVNNDSAYSQTRQFDYYKNLGVTATNYSGAAKQYTGGVSYVWTRSATTGYNDSYITVNQSGDPFISNMARNNCRIAPAFKLK